MYDGRDPVCEFNGAGQLTALNTFGAMGLASRSAGGASTFYAFDERGNVAQRLNAAGVVTSADLYDAYGKLLAGGAAGGSAADPWGFGAQAGYYADKETGLSLLTHRFYDPAQGRFLTRDPAGYGGGINLYSYTGNNPVNRMDPSGYGFLDDGEQVAQQLPPGARNLAEGALLAAGAAVIAYNWLHNHPPISFPTFHFPPITWTPPWAHLAPPITIASPVPADKAFPGVDPRAQAKHDPTCEDYDPTKTPLIEHELPQGKTVEDALRDAWNNPVAGDPNRGQTFGKPGYPVNRAGDEWLDLRNGLGGRGPVHGFPVSGPN